MFFKNFKFYIKDLWFEIWLQLFSYSLNRITCIKKLFVKNLSICQFLFISRYVCSWSAALLNKRVLNFNKLFDNAIMPLERVYNFTVKLLAKTISHVPKRERILLSSGLKSLSKKKKILNLESFIYLEDVK